jgi:hypothetical protein
MLNVTIALPDRLAHDLEAIATAQGKSIQQLALERLSSLVEVNVEPRAGSPAAILRAVQEPPYPSDADVDDLEAAMTAGRSPCLTSSTDLR